MEWTKTDQTLPIKSWCGDMEAEALKQAENLANHPVIVGHVALMPDCHVGYGMPIGGVIAVDNAVIPNAVGVDIGCGMCAVQTNIKAQLIESKQQIRSIMDTVKQSVPVGEGRAHGSRQEWDGFAHYLKDLGINPESFSGSESALPEWMTKRGWHLDGCNLGTLGGGNHFIELQAGDDGFVWLMLHSGSRNLGYRIASHYHKLAQTLNQKWETDIPSTDLAFLPMDSPEGKAYVRDMTYALNYAAENRKRMMAAFKTSLVKVIGNVNFINEINIHHNYAALENHFGKNVWIHRKGATSAKKGEFGIIPGSMGTPSYIVEGLGNPESLESCSHGAGRKMGRMEASRQFTVEECDAAMGDIVFDRWNKLKFRNRRSKKGLNGAYDLGEAPLAYKDIDAVINAELDLIKPLVRLKPLGVLKG